mgnify:CR=1 FL=1
MVGVFCLVLAIIGINIIGSILAGIKNKNNPIIYMKGAFKRYIGRIREAKFKRNWFSNIIEFYKMIVFYVDIHNQFVILD